MSVEAGFLNVPFSSLDKLPTIPAVYVVFDDEGQALYAGKSININTRWKSHHRHDQLVAARAETIVYIPNPESTLPYLESKVIEEFRPRFNNTPTDGSVIDPSSLNSVLTTVRVPSRLREEFQIAAQLDGLDASAMIRSFMVRVVREAKEREPEAFIK